MNPLFYWLQAELAEFDEMAPMEGVAAKNGAAGDDAATLEGSASDPLARIARQRQQKNKQQQQESEEAEGKCPLGETEDEGTTPEAALERELAEFEALLKPIELYGVNHLESFQDDTLNLELEQVEVGSASISCNSIHPRSRPLL